MIKAHSLKSKPGRQLEVRAPRLLIFCLARPFFCFVQIMYFPFGCTRLGFWFLADVFWGVSIHLVPAAMMDQGICKTREQDHHIALMGVSEISEKEFQFKSSFKKMVK